MKALLKETKTKLSSTNSQVQKLLQGSNNHQVLIVSYDYHNPLSQIEAEKSVLLRVNMEQLSFKSEKPVDYSNPYSKKRDKLVKKVIINVGPSCYKHVYPIRFEIFDERKVNK